VSSARSNADLNIADRKEVSRIYHSCRSFDILKSRRLTVSITIIVRYPMQNLPALVEKQESEYKNQN
jgi:hypothetical protein